ncbi:MAG: hypothetical protein HQK55_11030 [Deltaproteobacteria bacterium]|nr:hypothetical protein [Deltaproteobacteria bacterium]
MKRLILTFFVVLVMILTAAGLQARDISKSLKFAPGTSEAVIRGAVIRGDQDIYEINASEGQTMEVSINALEDNAAFVLRAPRSAGGKPLKGADEGDDATQWKGKLPGTGVYRIEVGGTRGNAEYKLKVSIH